MAIIYDVTVFVQSSVSTSAEKNILQFNRLKTTRKVTHCLDVGTSA
jgi:hypothetical protein